MSYPLISPDFAESQAVEDGVVRSRPSIFRVSCDMTGLVIKAKRFKGDLGSIGV